MTTLELGFHPANLTINGDVTLTENPAALPIGQSPFNIIHNDQGLDVIFKFDIEGVLTGSLFGHWHLGVHFEKFGPGEGPPSLFWTGTNGVITSTLNQTIHIPARHFNPVLLQGQNIFKVVATIVFHKSNASHGMPIAGFQDLGLLQVYNIG